jgi:hypothetical protein
VDQFAQFVHVVGTDEPFALPDPDDRCFPFDLVALNPDRTAVLMFLVKAAEGRVRLAMWFNDNTGDEISVIMDSSDSEAVRSFHEVLPGAHLREGRNVLCMNITSTHGGTGEVQISDVVLFYHAKT